MKVENLHKAFKRLNLSRLCLAAVFALALALSPVFASGDDDDDDDDGRGHNQHGGNHGNQHNYNHCKPKPKYCESQLLVVDEDLNLGSFFSNGRYDLPSPTSEGNQIEFILKGDRYLTYTVDFDFENRVDLPMGYAEITEWTWERADCWTWGHYGWRHRNRTRSFYCVKLYHYWCGGRCDNFARFRLTANTLYVSPNATPGPIQFEVTLTATANI